MGNDLNKWQPDDIGNPWAWLFGLALILSAWVTILYIVFDTVYELLKHGRVI